MNIPEKPPAPSLVLVKPHGKSRPKILSECALEYARKGFHIFPCHYPNKDGYCSCLNPDCKSPGKHPITPNGHKDATTDENKICKWWAEWPNANIGLAIKQSGLLVVDMDRHPDKPDGVENFKAIRGEEKYSQKPPMAVTGGNGIHQFYQAPNGKVRGKMAESIDIKTDGYVILPPSRHASGKHYKWVEDRSILECPPPPPDDWLSSEILVSTGKNNEKADSYPDSFGETIIPQCGFMRHWAKNSDNLPEQDWYMGIGVLAYTVDGPEIIHKYSSLYPNYNLKETNTKLEHWKRDSKGPATCQAIQKKCGSEHCTGCPHKGTIRSPIVLGREGKPVVSVNTMTIPQQTEIILKALQALQCDNPKFFIYGGVLIEVTL